MAISYRSGTANINTLTATTPAGVVSGDFLVAHVGFSSQSDVLTGPTGWTRQGGIQSTTQGNGLDVWTKVAGAGEPASYTWSGTVTYTDIALDAYIGVDNTTPIDVASAFSQFNVATTAPTSPSVTTVTDNAWGICGLWSLTTTSITAPSGTTQRENFDSAAIAVADFTQTPAGATGTKTWTTSNNFSLTSMSALRPAGGATPAAVVPPMRTLRGAGV